MSERRCENWLKTLGQVVDRTEAPAHYWLWSGLFTLGAAMERKVWVPYGLDDIYPNHYIILVSPPGKCRKGGPIALSKRFLEKVQCTVSKDSTSKQALCNELAASFAQVVLPEMGTVQQSPMAVISKEFSSLLSVDPKQMIEFLTDIYDSHDVWEYRVLSREPEKLYGPCVGLFAATTPTYMANNLPYEAFGAGFFSRVVFIIGTEKKQRIPRPMLDEEERYLMKDLVHDLGIIRHLRGPFQWEDKAGEYFDAWYNELDVKYAEIKDERFHGFIERAHISVLKTAMCIRVSYSDDLTFTVNDIGQAIEEVNSIFPTLSMAFGAMGRSERSQDIQDVMNQLKVVSPISFSQLLGDNWMNMTSPALREVIDVLQKRKMIRSEYRADGEEWYYWL